MVHSPDGDPDFFKVTSGVLQEEPMFIIWLDNLLNRKLFYS